MSTQHSGNQNNFIYSACGTLIWICSRGLFGLGFLQLYDGVDRFSWLPTVSPTSHSLVVAFHLVFVISVIFYRDYLLLVLINFIQLFFWGWSVSEICKYWNWYNFLSILHGLIWFLKRHDISEKQQMYQNFFWPLRSKPSFSCTLY